MLHTWPSTEVVKKHLVKFFTSKICSNKNTTNESIYYIIRYVDEPDMVALSELKLEKINIVFFLFVFFISNKINKDKASSVMDGHKIINFIYATYIYRTSHPL